MTRLKVLIADDHAVLRAGLRLLIDGQPDMAVVGEAGDGREALDKTRELRPDVLVLDLNMPGGGFARRIERLRADCPDTRIVVLTMHDDPAYFRAALAAGASGYVVKTAADSDLLTAIRAVARGRTFIDLTLDEALRPAGSGALPGSATAAGLSDLAPREREVLELLGQGHTNQAIADRLVLSVKTVETYRARLAEKLGLRSRADFVRLAAEMGWMGAGTGPPGPGADE